MLADNKLTDRSSWDERKLALVLKDLSELAIEFEIEATGFATSEIDIKIQSLTPSDIGEADDFETVSGPATSQLGDLWILGGHRLYCGSSLDPITYEKLLEGRKAAAVFTDPPYNVRIAGHVSGNGAVRHREFTMASGEMDEQEFADFLTKAMTIVGQNCERGAVAFVCMDWRHMVELHQAGTTANFTLLNLCVWIKSNGGMGSFYRSRHELIFVFRNGGDSHRNNVQLGTHGRNRTNCWHYDGANSFARKGKENRLHEHPTIKPTALVADAILDCTAQDEIVLDAFVGSGTTLLAAEHTGRRCAYGALSREHQKLLDQLVKAARAKPNGRLELPRRIKPGSELVRTWNRHTYRVVVLEGGFAYEGRTYKSLSEIASEITGTKWNGPRFFGLVPQQYYAFHPSILAPCDMYRVALIGDKHQRPNAQMDEYATLQVHQQG